MNPKKGRDHRDIDKAAQHVLYEIRMLLYAAEHLESGHSSPRSTPDGDLKNMALECFLLHYRNLRAFLCPSLQGTPRKDDIVGSDFLREPNVIDVASAPNLADSKARLDQMLAHLSYERDTYIEAKDHYWPTAKMLETLASEFRSSCLPAPYKERFASEFSGFTSNPTATRSTSTSFIMTEHRFPSLAASEVGGQLPQRQKPKIEKE